MLDFEFLSRYYPLRFDRIEFARDGGSESYIAYAAGEKYFLRRIKPAFIEAAVRGAEVQVFLQARGFSAPPVVRTKDGAACAQGDGLFILYAYIEGGEADPLQDANAVGALTGRMHDIMQSYPGRLIRRDKQYYIGRYVDLLRGRHYPKAEDFAALGEALWARVRDLPRGACHGDLYRGNVLKTPEGRFFILDFDTFCEGFSLYDAALFCNRTDYFKFTRGGYAKTRRAFEEFLPAYLNQYALEQADFNALCDLIGVYHFALQATMIALYGPDCVDEAFLDNQLHWLLRWTKQTGGA